MTPEDCKRINMTYAQYVGYRFHAKVLADYRHAEVLARYRERYPDIALAWADFDGVFWGHAKALLEKVTTVQTDNRRALMREIRGTPTRSLFARANLLAELASLHARTYAGYGEARPPQTPPEPYKVDADQARIAVNKFLWILIQDKRLRERVPANALEALAVARFRETFDRLNPVVVTGA